MLGALVAGPSATLAQTVTTVPFSPAAIPVDHPAALAALVVAVIACALWGARRGGPAFRAMRLWALAMATLSCAATAFWGHEVRAQLQELQRVFNQANGQTVTVPVQSTGSSPQGSPLGFLPVVYTNQTSASLRLSSITAPSWDTCFPLGVPSPLPVTPARSDTRCAVGTVLAAGGACWVDVAQLCADAASALRGSHPSNLVADVLTVTEGAQASVNVLGNDSDLDGPLVVSSFAFQGSTYAAGASATVAGYGTLTLQASGMLNFQAAPTFSGVRPFQVTYTVQTGASSTVAVTVNLAVTNAPPVAVNDAVTTNRNTAVPVPVRANDSDPDNDALTVSAVTQGVHGAVTIDPVTGNPSYTPNAGFVGGDSFAYTLSDGRGGTATATVAVTVVAPPNQAPVASDDTVSTSVNTPVLIPIATLLANDSDPDAEALELLSVQAAQRGSVSIAGSNVQFTPESGYDGLASFTYTIKDPNAATSTATVTVRVVGTASTPSVVVLRTLVAVARGTGGTSVRFPIVTALVDTDGSETLTVRVSGVPTNLSFSAGTNLGGGVWQLAQADLANLQLNLPGSYTTLGTNMTVQVTSTEVSNSATASVSVAVTLRAGYTTVDGTSTQSGSFTGTSANDFIQGGSGDNTLNAGNGSNVVQGGDGNDTITAGLGADVLYGELGNDSLHAGSGLDVLWGGPGDDTLQGGDAGENFVDVFVWTLGDQGPPGSPAVDTITAFSTAAAGAAMGGDVIYLQDFLQGAVVGPSNGAGNLADYLHFSVSGSDTVIHISHTGGFAGDAHTVSGAFTSAAETQRIVLSGVDLPSVYGGATTDQQIITQLLNNHKLVVD
ncbi:midcut-by-XrtH protein [Acidovorax lacteus]|uniref:Tandem-95 repeat protein n=1 Tax=Acidovorax lacteus TaxID=1924988 RepID=A0ABP8L018_9BURK